MAAKTGSTYISGNTTDSVEIPTANLTFSTMPKLPNPIKIQPSDCNNDGQPKMARLAAQTSIMPPFPVVDRCRNRPRQFLRARRGQKPQICLWNFGRMYRGSRNINTSISGLGLLSSVPPLARWRECVPIQVYPLLIRTLSGVDRWKTVHPSAKVTQERHICGMSTRG